MIRLSILFIVPIFINCASTIQFANYPNQKVEIEDSTKSRIYVYRPTSFGGAISIPILSGNKLIGNTGSNGYLCWEEEPGEMTLQAKAENIDTLKFRSMSGQQYYVKQSIRMGALYARNDLAIVEIKEALKEMSSCSQPELSSKSSFSKAVDTTKHSPALDTINSNNRETQSDQQIIQKTTSKNSNRAAVLLLVSIGLLVTVLIMNATLLKV